MATPVGLDRRFEAVVLWSTGVAVPARTARPLLALCQAGAPVAWLAPAPVEDLAARLGSPAPGAAPLILADTRGTGIGLLDHAGIRPLGGPPRDLDLSALDRAADALVRALAERGLAAVAPTRPPDRPGTTVGLVHDPAVRTTWSSLKRLLVAHGITGVPGLADLASEAARGAGIDDPRVLVEDTRVEIAVVDPGDVGIDVVQALWQRGVDPRATLVVFDGLAGVPHRPAPLVDPDVREATFVLVHRGPSSPRSGMVVLAGGQARLRQLLADQLRRRRRRALPVDTDRAGWSLVVEGFDKEHERVREALLTLADGHIGTSGAPLASDPGRHPWVVAAGVYDGDGAHSHLLTGPVAFELGGTAPPAGLRRVLDLRTGVLHEVAGSGATRVESVRFASLARPTTEVLRARGPQDLRPDPPLRPPSDDPVRDHGRGGAASWIRVAATHGGIVAAAAQRCSDRRPAADGPAADRVLDRIAVYRADTDDLPDPSPAVDAVGRAATMGFDRLLTEHRQAWAARWEDADVTVEGDDDLQLGIRLALFHLMASVADSGEAAVGARGLTGTGYGGHVFWDADTYVLPFLAATHPASARAMLEYRLRRLPAAMEAARAAGRPGARFPWESARTGDDVTPTTARDRSGRLVPIRTGQLEEHIVAQVPWAACCYVDWSGDDDFARGPLRRLLVETARYWASRIRVEPGGIAHIYGVVGPDEYHEPVDDNAFTNVMARWNLRRAAEAAAATGHDVDHAERRHWLELADALFDGYDADTGIYEQFAGFHRLEPLIIAEVAPRRPIAADLMLGAERTQGAQVVKQADVLLLHHLVPDQVEPGSLEPNIRYYEPRTAHGSSLSPAVHAAVLARARRFEEALEALRIAVRMDLDDLTGSSAQGLHLATMGGVWQALAFGIMGLRPHRRVLHVDPVLPPSWSALELRLRLHGARVQVRKERGRLTIHADRRISVLVGGTSLAGGPGRLAFRRRGSRWEVVP